MTWTAVLLLVLVSSAPPHDKKKEAKPTPPAQGASPTSLERQAEEKAAAGDLPGAIELLEKATRSADAGGGTWLHLGRVLERKRDLQLSADAYGTAAGKLEGPAKGEALGRLSLLQQLTDARGAAATAEAAAAADPNGLWPLAALTFVRAGTGQGHEALALARKATEAGTSALAQTASGRAAEAIGDPKAAEVAYREAASAPDAPLLASLGLARVLRRTSRAADALPLVQHVTEQAPGAVEAYKESARVKLALGRPDDAVADAAIAAAMAEGDADALSLRLEVSVAQALANVAKNQAALAVQDLTRLRDQNPGAASVRVGLAKALSASRQVDAALTELEKAIELDSGLAEAHFQLGYVRHALKGNAALALPAYEKAAAAEPGNATYRTSLGAALVGTKQFDRAVEELTKATLTPGYDRPDAWIYLGQAHVGAKRYRDAIPPLEKALAVSPDNDLAHAFLGWAYFGLKDVEAFKKHAGRARTLGHKEPTLLDYLRRVEGGEPIK